ncbi:MAG: hypothetical protein JNM44_14670 [Chitinophagaceae bacterium]|nr:hypothetical protein [Chitinophagaceae bacterium]
MFNLKNFKKEIAAAYFKGGATLLKEGAVRELDEENKNQFVAYVDEGRDSRDVCIWLNDKNEIEKHSCDCGDEYFFCIHKVAVCLHLAEYGGKVKVSKVKTVRKAGFSLEGIKQEDLADWLASVFKSHKYLKEEFKLRFSTQNDELTAESITTQLQAFIKSVIGNKRSADAASIKRLVGLWDPYMAQVGESLHFREHLLEDLQKSAAMLKVVSRIQNYVTTSSKKVKDSLHQVMDQLARKWDALSTTEFKNLLNELQSRFKTSKEDTYEGVWVEMLFKVYSLDGTRHQKAICSFIDAEWSSKRLAPWIQESELMKRIIELINGDTGEALLLLPKLKPIQWELKYNLSLIQIHLDQNNFKQAETFCKICIKNNYNQEFDEPYLRLLEKIYLSTENQDALLKTWVDLIWLVPDIERYKMVSKAFKNAEDHKVFRNKLFTKSRHRGQEIGPFRTFWIDLLVYENKMAKLIEYLSSQCYLLDLENRYSLLYTHDGLKFLKIALSAQVDRYNDNDETTQRETVIAKEIIDFIEMRYESKIIKQCIQQHSTHRYWNYSPEPIYAFLKSRHT